MSENRGAVRTTFRAQIKMTHPEVGVYEVVTRDMSHSGLFLIWKEPFDIKIDDIISVQTLDIEDAPIIRARVVRIESGGIAVTYVFDEDE